jgi:hypothetical protein
MTEQVVGITLLVFETKNIREQDWKGVLQRFLSIPAHLSQNHVMSTTLILTSTDCITTLGS